MLEVVGTGTFESVQAVYTATITTGATIEPSINRAVYAENYKTYQAIYPMDYTCHNIEFGASLAIRSPMRDAAR